MKCWSFFLKFILKHLFQFVKYFNESSILNQICIRNRFSVQPRYSCLPFFRHYTYKISETTVRNLLYCLFPYFHDYYIPTANLVLSIPNNSISHKMTIEERKLDLALRSLYFKSFRSSLQSHTKWAARISLPPREGFQRNFGINKEQDLI